MAAVLAAALTGCAPSTLLQDQWPANAPATVELVSTPFFPQDDYQCGPAALATLLGAAGRPSSPEALVDEVYIPARQGSLQPEMIAAARQRGLVVYPVRKTLPDLLAQLEAGHPVLVLQNLGIPALPVWHYAVVIGADAGADRIILRSGRERRRLESAGDFMRRWGLTGYWGIVALPPGALPANPDWPVYLSAVADLETAGHREGAGRAYGAALAMEPDLAAARLGLANVLYASGRFEEAAALYESLAGDPDYAPVALNNLANLRADQGCMEAASDAIERALAVAGPDSGFESALASTRARVAAQASGDHHCAEPSR
ncbi:MAG: PA2778 family cysteine peptidase [Gammaproteobacteria bacterium]